jgi:uncharacterized membrane protein YfcA
MWDSICQVIQTAGYYGLAIACLASLIAGFLRGFIGFGAALVMTPVLSLVYSPTVAVPIAFLSAVPAVIQLLPPTIKYGERAFVLPLGLTALFASPVGAWLLSNGDPRILKIGISSLILIMAFALFRGWRFKKSPGTAVLGAVGLLSGFLQGLASVGGPPAVAAALSRPGDVYAQRGNILAAAAVLTASNIIPLWALGLFKEQTLILAAILVPPHLIAAWVGNRYFDGRGKTHFHRAAVIMLIAIASTTLILSISDYMTG